LKAASALRQLDRGLCRPTACMIDAAGSSIVCVGGNVWHCQATALGRHLTSCSFGHFSALSDDIPDQLTYLPAYNDDIMLAECMPNLTVFSFHASRNIFLVHNLKERKHA